LTQRFLIEGWTVVAHYFEESDEFKKFKKNQRLIPIYCNFLNAESWDQFLEKIADYDFSALVNNAGIHDCSKGNMSAIKDVFMINTITPVLLAKKIIQKMKTKKFGHIVNVGSIGAKYGSNMDSIFYSVSKGGLEAATKSLAREGAPYNVLVNMVRPGVMDTNFFRSLQKDEESRKNMIPLKRFSQADEVSEFVLFLCTKNTYITSEILSISGGE
jgi:NAD(P)-dependent dehydrogenase (short-subunit alcohol dehydrogenase family)